MTYNIISTGSKGNAVQLGGSLLIDCGVPFKALADCYKDLKLVLLTHEHSDHINKATAKRLAAERPTLRWGCCEWMVPIIADLVPRKQIDIYTPGYCFIYRDMFTIVPERLTHNVPNCGYHIWRGTESVFYATDTGTLDGIEAKNYTLYMIEANHSREDIEARAKDKLDRGEFAYEIRAAENHLSKEQAEDWIYQNIGPNGRYVFLHQHEG